MDKQEIIYKQTSDLIPYANNTRTHSESQVKQIAASIKEFGFTNPILTDGSNGIIAGHGRVLAAEKLGLKELPCIELSHLSETQKKAYIIADNKLALNAGWDDDLLRVEIDGLKELDFDIDLLGFDDSDLDDLLNGGETDRDPTYTLAEKWIIPPFSIIDGRTGEWQSRKKQWLEMGIKSERGRRENLMNTPEAAGYIEGNCTHMAPSTSVFDPALCELMYKWFNTPQGAILDPFAGGSVRGIVASVLGYEYNGNDLSEEQIKANYKNAEEVGVSPPEWTIGDSLNIDKICAGKEFDFIFSCPPYADLEVYSDAKEDISNMVYDDFLTAYRGIILKTCSMLKNDRFACFVVGEVRDKKGRYYNFLGDTIKAFLDAGLSYYNEITYITPNGTAGMRADKTFSSGRKIVKTHQNVLVFYKGDPKKIKENYPELDLSYIEEVE